MAEVGVADAKAHVKGAMSAPIEFIHAKAGPTNPVYRRPARTFAHFTDALDKRAAGRRDLIRFNPIPFALAGEPFTLATASTGPEDDGDHPEDDVDGCVSDIQPDEGEATSDADLPPATGGVESSIKEAPAAGAEPAT